jgi:hypothetical protein
VVNRLPYDLFISAICAFTESRLKLAGAGVSALTVELQAAHQAASKISRMALMTVNFNSCNVLLKLFNLPVLTIHHEMTKNKTIIRFAICIIAFSCNRKMYYNTIQANTHDFDFVLSYIQKNKLLELNDSLELHDKTAIHFDNKCIYEEKIQDSLVVSFMKKYDLTRICFHKDKQNYYDSVITFHKN